MSLLEHAAWYAPLAAYEQQAEALWNAYRAQNARAIKLFHENLPRFLDTQVKWLPRNLEENEIERALLTLDDARLALA